MKTRLHSSPTSRPTTAFSLIEVMVAAGIFFVFIFAILAMVSSNLRNLRVLRRIDVDAGMVAAQLFRTNRVTEGSDSGDFGDMYRDHTWNMDLYEVETNGLWKADIQVLRRGVRDPVDQMTVLVFSPESSSMRPR